MAESTAVIHGLAIPLTDCSYRFFCSTPIPFHHVHKVSLAKARSPTERWARFGPVRSAAPKLNRFRRSESVNSSEIHSDRSSDQCDQRFIRRVWQGVECHSAAPVFTLGPDAEVVAVRYNNDDRSALTSVRPHQCVADQITVEHNRN